MPEICQHNATLTIDSIVICQTHAGYLCTFVHRMHPGTELQTTFEFKNIGTIISL